jgi:hypothetical protein
VSGSEKSPEGKPKGQVPPRGSAKKGRMAPKRPPIAASSKAGGTSSKSGGAKSGGNNSAGNKPGANKPGANKPGGNKAGSQPRGRQAAWQARRRRNRWLAVGSVVVVVVVVAAFIVVKASDGGSGGGLRKPAPIAVVNSLANVSMSTLVEATADKSLQLYYPAKAVGGRLTSGGKPEVLYIGAEFCPICATERWAMVVALSKFGTFSNLQQTHSALDDGDIPTLSFYGSTYTSPYLTFVSVENETNTSKLLQSYTSAENTLWKANEIAQGQSSEGYPFIDIGGVLALISAQTNDTLLISHSFSNIADSVGDNEKTIGVNEDASAAYLIKAICGVTGNKPAATCSAVAKLTIPSNTSSGESSPAS